MSELVAITNNHRMIKGCVNEEIYMLTYLTGIVREWDYRGFNDTCIG